MRRPNPLELKRRIGVLPEDLGLFDDLTVEEHLLLTGDIYGVPRQETRDAHVATAARAEPGARPPHVRRRLFPRDAQEDRFRHGAAAQSARCCFWTSPSKPSTRSRRRSCATCCNRSSRHGVTVFLTSHILSVVEQIATRIVMIRKGTIVWNSPVGEIAASRSRSIISIWWKRPWSRNWNGSARRDPEGAGRRRTAATRSRSNRWPATISSWSRRCCCSKAGIFVYLIMGLVLLFPLSTDPLRKIPPSRLALWPLGPARALDAAAGQSVDQSADVADGRGWPFGRRGAHVTVGLWAMVAGLFAAAFRAFGPAALRAAAHVAPRAAVFRDRSISWSARTCARFSPRWISIAR